MRDKRRMFTIIAAFALLLVTGIVYAATTGNLNFTGTAGFNTNVRLNIIDEAVTSPVPGEGVSVNAAKDTLTFTVHLSNPGETRYVKFRVENTGNADVVMGSLSYTLPEATSGITVSWPSLNGVTVATGGIMPATGEYIIGVTWNPDYPNVTQDVTLTAGISYAQGAGPAT